MILEQISPSMQIRFQIGKTDHVYYGVKYNTDIIITYGELNMQNED